MIPLCSYTAICWREGASWAVHLPQLGRTGTASDLARVEDVARGLVAEDGAPLGPCRVTVELALRHSLGELMAAAAAAREDPDRVSVEAVTLRRCLARRLAAEGFDVPDVAALLGLSYARARHLVGESSHPVLPAVLDIAPILTPIAAAGLAITQLVAASVHARRGEKQMIPINLVLAALAAFVAVMRFGPNAF